MHVRADAQQHSSISRQPFAGPEAVGVDSQVAKEKVEAMRAERDAFAERLRHVEAVTLQQDTSAVEELQVIA